jgi:hypothetical protein
MAIPLTVDMYDSLLTVDVNNFDPNTVLVTTTSHLEDQNADDVVDENAGQIDILFNLSVHCERFTVQAEDTQLTVEVD